MAREGGRETEGPRGPGPGEPEGPEGVNEDSGAGDQDRDSSH